MKMSEFKDLTLTELAAKGRDLRQEMFNLRFRNSMRQLDNPLKIREGRREIARLITVLCEKEGKTV